MATRSRCCNSWQRTLRPIPLYIDHSSELTLPSTQYDMYSSENAGLVKFDLLV